MARPVLHGYRHSVYTRIARLALLAKGVAHGYAEIDPFADPQAARAMHPFARVPVLTHDGLTLYETAVITRYVDRAFAGPPLQPVAGGAAGGAAGLAQMDQVIAIVDAYGYWPMVRQVFSQRVFAPFDGRSADTDEIARGLEGAAPVLAALEQIAAQGRVLTGAALTLADCHLAPMIDYFQRAPEGRAALRSWPELSRWWAWAGALAPMAASAPDPGLAAID